MRQQNAPCVHANRNKRPTDSAHQKCDWCLVDLRAMLQCNACIADDKHSHNNSCNHFVKKLNWLLKIKFIQTAKELIYLLLNKETVNKSYEISQIRRIFVNSMLLSRSFFEEKSFYQTQKATFNQVFYKFAL
jgi:hypothetical protein